MKKIRFWQKKTNKSRLHQGWLVEDRDNKFIVKVGDYLVEYHYPHATYAYEVIREDR